MFLKFLLLLSLEYSHSSGDPLPPYIVQASPLELFSDRTQDWNFSKIKNDNASKTSLSDSLLSEPGVFSQSEASNGNPSIRIRGSGSASRNLVLYNNTPINMDDGLGANPLLLGTENLESIDLLKGPASTFYGASAVGGAINLRPSILKRPSVRLGYESIEKYQTLLRSPLFKNETIHTQATALLEKSENTYEYDELNGQTQYKKNNGYNRQRYTFFGKYDLPNTVIEQDIIYAYENSEVPGPLPYQKNSVIFYDRKAYLFSLGAKHRVDQNWDLLFKSSYLNTNNQNKEPGSFTNFKSNRFIQTLGASFSYQNHSFELLNEYFNDNFKFLPVNKTESRFEHALIYRTQLSEKESLLAGVRYFPDINETAKNLRLSQDRDSYTLWASYSEGVKLPSFTEKYAENTFFRGNPGLEVEKSNQVELGAKKPISNQKNFFLDYFELSLSGFLTEYSDFIQFQSTPNPYSYQNLEKIEITGLESSLFSDYKIYHFKLGYSLQKVEDKSPSPREVLFIPRHQALLLLGAQISAFIFEIQNTYWSSFKTTTQKEEPAWLASDLVIKSSGLSNWSFQMGVKNIFNNRKSFLEGYPEPGRTYFLYVERFF